MWCFIAGYSYKANFVIRQDAKKDLYPIWMELGSQQMFDISGGADRPSSMQPSYSYSDFGKQLT